MFPGEPSGGLTPGEGSQPAVVAGFRRRLQLGASGCGCENRLPLPPALALTGEPQAAAVSWLLSAKQEKSHLTSAWGTCQSAFQPKLL